MVQEIVFKDATLEDLPRIVEIYNSTIPGRMVTADTEPVTVEDRLPWFHEHSPSKRPLWVVKLGDEICGWVSLSNFYGRPAYGATAEVSIYLDANYRGHGLGKKVLSKVIEEAPTCKVGTLLGFIFGHNEPSLRLFASFGFEKWAHLPEVAELDGVKRDLIIVGKKLK